MRYAKYGTMNLLLLLSAAALLLGGGWWLWLGFIAATATTVLADESSEDDLSAPGIAPARFLDAMLYLTLPLMVLNSFLFAHYLTAADPLGFAGWLGGMGIDFDTARQNTHWYQLLGGFLGMGILTGSGATNVAHELVHRTHSALSLLAGRWLLAFSCDTTFSIEHVHGHHRNVATAHDAATARRGEYVLAFFLRATLQGNIGAWRIETERLKRKGLPIAGLQNKVITGQFMSLAILAGYALIAGWAGVLGFLLVAVQGKLYLELVDYIEHYGLVRVPGSRIEARHSWNCYKWYSNGVLYNLPRHAHHHLFAGKPFWTLEVEEEAPTMPHGYMSMIIIALIPGWWKRTVDPLLKDWDERFANEAERSLLGEKSMLLARA